jgi:hypothetical protein
MINLPKERVGELLDIGEAALNAHNYTASADKPHARWAAACVLAALAPHLIPGSTTEDDLSQTELAE